MRLAKQDVPLKVGLPDRSVLMLRALEEVIETIDAMGMA